MLSFMILMPKVTYFNFKCLFGWEAMSDAYDIFKGQNLKVSLRFIFNGYTPWQHGLELRVYRSELRHKACCTQWLSRALLIRHSTWKWSLYLAWFKVYMKPVLRYAHVPARRAQVPQPGVPAMCNSVCPPEPDTLEKRRLMFSWATEKTKGHRSKPSSCGSRVTCFICCKVQERTSKMLTPH